MRLASFARFALWAVRLLLLATILIGTVVLVAEAVLMLAEGELLGLLVLVVAAVEVAILPAFMAALIARPGQAAKAAATSSR